MCNASSMLKIKMETLFPIKQEKKKNTQTHLQNQMPPNHSYVNYLLVSGKKKINKLVINFLKSIGLVWFGFVLVYIYIFFFVGFFFLEKTSAK